MRELVKDKNGVVRFKQNVIIDWLQETKRIDLNDIARHIGLFPIEDVEEFWQMLGYSVGGYGDLSFVREETIQEADEAMDRLLHPDDYLSGGMGDPMGR